MATLVFHFGDHFSPLAVIATFFLAPARFPEHLRNFDKFFSEAILFLDLGDQLETLAIIVIFRTSRRHLITTSSLLVASVPRRDLARVLGSRL